MAEEWLTYAALGERLGLSAEAARQKAKRLGLRRQTANDGKAQVLVDVEDVRTTTPPRKAPEPDVSPDHPPVDPRLIEALDDHIASLKEIVAREQARADGLQTRLDALMDGRAITGRSWWRRLAG